MSIWILFLTFSSFNSISYPQKPESSLVYIIYFPEWLTYANKLFTFQVISAGVYFSVIWKAIWKYSKILQDDKGQENKYIL